MGTLYAHAQIRMTNHPKTRNQPTNDRSNCSDRLLQVGKLTTPLVLVRNLSNQDHWMPASNSNPNHLPQLFFLLLTLNQLSFPVCGTTSTSHFYHPIRSLLKDFQPSNPCFKHSSLSFDTAHSVFGRRTKPSLSWSLCLKLQDHARSSTERWFFPTTSAHFLNLTLDSLPLMQGCRM